jgi:hypothetical protein
VYGNITKPTINESQLRDKFLNRSNSKSNTD